MTKLTLEQLNNSKSVHFVGIKGVGVSALAQILQMQGKVVTGSDTTEEFFTDTILSSHGIPFYEFSEENIIDSLDLVVFSSAYNLSNNIELRTAKTKEIQIVSYANLLALLFNSSFGIAITGSHGKSTTSALIAHMLNEAGRNPSAVIGAEVISWESNALVGDSEIFVAEADEYQEKFALLLPHILVVTNIDWDHPEHFKSEKEYIGAYSKYIHSLPSEVKILINSRDTVSCDIVRGAGKANLHYFGGSNDHVKLPIISGGASSIVGAALEVGKLLEINDDDLVHAVENFSGIRRRAELYGRLEKNGKYVALYDDYAHHPAEISATIKAFHNSYSSYKIILAFQPHTISRTSALLEEFANAFGGVDALYLLPTYTSAREGGDTVQIDEKLFNAVNSSQKSPNTVSRVSTLEQCGSDISQTLRGEEVVIAMGAGDVWRVLIEIQKRCKT